MTGKEARCSIEECKERVALKDRPYCAAHEERYGREWARCWQCRSVCAWIIPDGHNACSFHGGADYTPHTKEES